MLAHDFMLFPEDQMNTILASQKEFSNMDGFRFGRFTPVPPLTNQQEKADTAALTLLIEIYRKSKNDMMQIKDEYILPVLDSFEEIDTFSDGCIPYRGLDYYGFTVIPTESIPQFEKVIHGMSQNQEFAPLLALCEKARTLRCCILHCGI